MVVAHVKYKGSEFGKDRDLVFGWVHSLPGVSKAMNCARPVPERSFHYRVIKNVRLPGPKFSSEDLVVATGLTWKKAKQLEERLTIEHAEESSWTGPVFYCEQEPQTEWEFA